MRVARIEVFHIDIPYKKVFRIATAEYRSQPFVVVHVVADDGSEGWGEACPAHEFTGETGGTVFSIIAELLGRRLIGRDPMDLEDLVLRAMGGVAGAPSAKAALDMALHDLAAKALGVPLYRLLGGPVRRSFPVTGGASLAGIEETLEKVRRDVERGIRVLKIKVGEDPERDAEKVRRVREVVGDKPVIRVDANQGWWRPRRAIRAIRLMERYGIELVEQPVAAWDLDGLAEVRRAVDTPIMVDESVHTPLDVVRVAEKRAADIVNIKLMKTGGIRMALRVAAVAEAMGLEAYMGSMGETAIGRAANIHLALSLDVIRYGDIAGVVREWGIVEDIAEGLREGMVNGALHVLPPGKPGLGVEVRREVLEKYLVNHTVIK